MSEFKGRRFETEIVLWAVRWYCRYGISYRDLEQMMAERGVPVDHSTIYRRVQVYAPEIEKRLRWPWRRPSSTPSSQFVGSLYGVVSERLSSLATLSRTKLLGTYRWDTAPFKVMGFHTSVKPCSGL